MPRTRRRARSPPHRKNIFKINDILAVTDLSPQADAAVERAAVLARAQRARLVLLHVMGRSALETLQRIFAGHPPLAERELAQSARRALEATAAAARSRRGVDVECRITVGAVAAKIARQAQSGAADVIVIGAHGENFVREILLGTTAEKVVRAASPMRGSSATGKSRAVRPGAK